MKKILSLLLASALVISLLPGTAVPVAAAGETAPAQNNYYSNVIVQESFDDINAGITRGQNGKSTDEQYTVQATGAAHIKTGTMTESGVCDAVTAGLDLLTTTFDVNRGFEVRFVADFNDLVIAKPNTSSSATSGLIVDVRAAVRCRYSFFADAEGNIYVSQYDQGQVAYFDTGADLGDKQVDVRIVVDDDMRGTVVVNGQYVARFRTSQGAPTSNHHFLLYTGTANRVDDSRVNDVVLHDLKLAQGVADTDVLQAYYTYDAPYLDGKFDEINWPFDNGNRVAMLSDEEYLYIGVNNTDPDPDFVINGAKLTANPKTGIVTLSNGKFAGEVIRNGNLTEIRIPLKSALGLEFAPGQRVKFTYAWNSFDGDVVLAERSMISNESFDAKKTGLGNTGSEVYAVQDGNGKILLKTGTYSAGGVQDLHHKDIDASKMAIDKGYDFEFTADFTDLIVPVVPGTKQEWSWSKMQYVTVATNPSSPFYWYDAGFGIELRAEPCRYYGFHADANGNIYVTQRMNASSQVTRIDTGLDVGATNVHVRLSAADNGVTTIYINGEPLAETLPAPTWACPLTGGLGYYRFHNSTRNRDTSSSRVNDVTLYNLMVFQDAPAPQLKEQTLAANANVDMTAYLNLGGIKLDGVPGEAEWYTPHMMAGTGNAPAGTVGMGWGDGNLYVGGDAMADTVSVTIGGKKVTANLNAASNEYAASNTGFEWIIPLSKFDLSGVVLDKSVSYEIKLTDANGSSSLKGTLTFVGEQILFGDTGHNLSEKDYLLGNGDGHIRWSRTGNGQAISAVGLDAKKEDGSLYAAGAMCGHQRFIPVDYASGAFNLELTTTINSLPYIVGDHDVMGMYGVTFQVVGENMRGIFALCNDGKGNVVMVMRHTLETETFNTGVKVGADEPVTFRFEVDKKQSMSLYINGEFAHAFSPIERTDTTATNIKLSEPCLMYGVNHGYRQPNEGGAANIVDVVLHDIHLTKVPYEGAAAVVQAALEQITQDLILDGGDPTDVTALALPNCVYVDGIGELVNLTWSAIDKQTGRTAYNVDVEQGIVTRMATAQSFDLKVTAGYKDAIDSKNFTLQTKGYNTAVGSIALIEHDDAPAAGVVTDWNSDRYAYLDDTHNSIVINRGSATPFNRIVLRDTDEYSRVSQRHLGVFISNDGKTWTKVTGWLLHQDGRTYTLYNLNATAQYVKVHCYHDDLDLVEKPSFYNKVSEMIKVSNEKTLPGARGNFAYTTTFQATNSTDSEQKDTPVFISLTALGAKAGQYKTGCPDFRFTIGETTLAHWYNGKDGFYVRVPAIPAKGNVEITAHWGCSSAQDFSDGEAVFEVTYGNVSLINISRETYEGSGGDLEKSILSHGRPFTFPNGDVIVVGRTMKAASNAGVFRSTDGGHTFRFDNMAFLDGDYISAVSFNGSTYRSSGFGGYMWDDSIKTEKNGVKYEGRLYLITYSGQGGNASDYRLVLQYSDDYAHTWSEPVFLSLPGASDVINKNTKVSAVSTLQNAEARIGAMDKVDDGDPNTIKAGEMASRAQIVCDGLVLKGADGAGPNVDYIIHHGEVIYDYTLDANGNRVATSPDKNKRNVATAIYSSDGGKTWTCSDTLICIPGVLPTRNAEDGLSEGSIAQLDNGDLYVVIRAQEEGNYFQYEAVSKDFGKTWTSGYDNVLSSNTSPVLVEYGNDRLEMWSACTGLGEISYRRTPMHLGLSTDNYQTFDKILDLTFSTAFDSVRALQGRKSQPGIGISADGKNAFVCYHDQIWHKNEGAWAVDAGKFLEKGGTMGFAIEEFDEMVYGTKGAWDDFEDASLKYQGWLTDVDSTIELSREQAVSGKYSMKVLDESTSAPAHALRQIPSIKSGTVGAKLMVPKSNEAPFVMELKAAYNYDHMKFTLAAIYVTPNGTVGYVDANKVQHALTTVKAGSWNDYALSFDVSSGKGTLYVNGTDVGTFNLPEVERDIDLVHGVTVVQFNQAAATRRNSDCLYVDDFYVNELVGISRTLEAPAAQTTIGRFMTIVRRIIEVNGEQVELVEWGWVPGL